AAVAMAAAWIPFPSGRRLAAAGSAIARFGRELRGSRTGTRLGAAVGEGVHVAVLRPHIRAVIAVGAATVGIAIALLAGVAPLAWTLTAIGLLLVSPIASAGLDSRAELLEPSDCSPAAAEQSSPRDRTEDLRGRI